MKISNIKSLEKYTRRLSEQINYCKAEQNTPEETNILQELEGELNRVSGYLNNLRLIKNSPPGVVINFLKAYVQEYLPILAPAITFEIRDEKRISVHIKAAILGYNLDINHDYEPVNEQHSDNWEQMGDSIHRKNHPLRPFIDRLNKLDQDFLCDIIHGYDSLNFEFQFSKVHASQDVLQPLWTDVLREVVQVCNLHRNRQNLEPV